MLIGVIADDFTGASDIANTLAKGGLSTVQFVGVPDAVPADCAVGVISLKSRSTPAVEAVRDSLAACDWLVKAGARQIIFKYCSTFDSSPEGNIGPVAEALLDRLGAEVAVVCPVFPATGRTLFMGHLFVKDRPLNESGLEHHPLNPMTDADIRRWLRRQTRGEVGHVPYATVRQGPEAVGAAMAAEAAAGRRLVVVDAVADDDLRVIGKAIAGHRLITGGSGIALGLPDNLRAAGLVGPDAHSAFTPVEGPAVVLSGSCSPASREQIAHYAATHPALLVAPDELMAGRIDAGKAVAWARERLDQAPAVYTTADPAEVAAAQMRHGREHLAAGIERFFGTVAAGLAQAGVRRMAIGGGETSGAVVTALAVKAFAVGPEIDPGVPALAEVGSRGLRLALKSGNFGALDFYDKALRRLAKG